MGKQVIEDIANQTNIYNSNTPIENHLQFWQQAISQENLQIKINDTGDFSKIPHDAICKIINQTQTAEIEKTNIEKWNNQVATPEEIIEDLNATLKKNKTMFMNPELSRAFAIRAIQGHAQNGHGKFTRDIGDNKIPNPYPNTTTENVLDAIEEGSPRKFRKHLTREKFQKASQRSNDDIVYCMEDWFKQIEKNVSNVASRSSIIKLQNRENKALNKISFLRGMSVDILELARGFYLTTNMDDFKGIRIHGFEKYSHQTGGGECYLTATEKLKKYQIGIKDLSGIKYKGIFNILNYLPYKARIDMLEKLEIITNKTLPLEKIAEGELTWDGIKFHESTTNLLKNPEHWGQYIRDVWGRGVGDDLVIWLAGFLPPTIYKEGIKESRFSHQSKIIGGLFGDQIDTSEKDAKLFIPGGQDKIAGKHINGLYRKLARHKKFRERFNIQERKDGQYNLVDHEEIVDFTFAGANTFKQHVHSSQRYFYKSIQKTCAISQYITYAYFCAKAHNREVYLSDIKGFKINLEEDPENVRMTFKGISLKEIRKIMKERLDLVIDPKKREERLRQYYLEN